MHRLPFILLAFLWIWLVPVVGAQPGREGPLATALGGASVALTGDIWGMTNPAAWSGQRAPAAAFFASEGYGLSALRHGSARLLWPFPRLTAAVGASTMGDALFRESIWLLGAAAPVYPGTHRAIDLGLRLTLHQVNIAGYGNALALGVAAGWQVDLGTALRLGASAEGLNRPRWTRGEPLPRRLQAGLAYTPRDAPLTLLLAARHTTYRPPSLHAGFLWRLHQAFDLLGGLAGPPWRMATGFSLRAGIWRIDTAAERHETLGWTPLVALGLSRRGGT